MKTTVMKFNGSSWTNVWSPWFSAGGASFQSLAIDNNWTPYVAYMDNQNWYKTTVMKFYENILLLFSDRYKMEMCLSGWNNDNFIDDSFWAQNPSDLNILCALYGSDEQIKLLTHKYGNDELMDDCGVAHMNVHVTNPSSVPLVLWIVTLFMCFNQAHTICQTMWVLNMCRFVSSGETKIANYDDYNISIDNTFVIIDNINIYGDDYASYGIILRSNEALYTIWGYIIM